MKNKIFPFICAFLICALSVIPAFADESDDRIIDIYKNADFTQAQTMVKHKQVYADQVLLGAKDVTFFNDGLDVISSTDISRVVDDADLLNDIEEEELLNKLNEISERQQFDVVVVTTNTLDGKTAEAYADDYYDYNGYGYGSENDGALLLVSMEDRDWHITTTGFGRRAITDRGLEYFEDQFLYDLSDGFYYDVFVKYADLCDQFVTQAKTGAPYDVGNMPKGKVKVTTIILAILGSFGLGFLFSGIPMSSLKAQLKTVRSKPDADSYLKPGSFMVNEKSDIFLYRTVTKRAKPQNTSSGGGSSTHRGSSGTSHGGGGGKF